MTELLIAAPNHGVHHRRNRIVATAAVIAESGGYDAVAMRAVAEAAGVSTATLYRYFPSKHHLLVATLSDWLERFDTRVDGDGADHDEPFTRLWFVIDSLYTDLRSRPLLAEAMARAYATADATMAAQVEHVREHLADIFASALSKTEAGRATAIGSLLSDVWAANVLTLSQNRITDVELRARMATIVRVLSRGTR